MKTIKEASGECRLHGNSFTEGGISSGEELGEMQGKNYFITERVLISNCLLRGSYFIDPNYEVFCSINI